MLAVVKYAGREHGVAARLLYRLGKVLERSGPAAGDDRD
jgi:hypothetical protein